MGGGQRLEGQRVEDICYIIIAHPLELTRNRLLIMMIRSGEQGLSRNVKMCQERMICFPDGDFYPDFEYLRLLHYVRHQFGGDLTGNKGEKG